MSKTTADLSRKRTAMFMLLLGCAFMVFAAANLIIRWNAGFGVNAPPGKPSGGADASMVHPKVRIEPPADADGNSPPVDKAQKPAGTDGPREPETSLKNSRTHTRGTAQSRFLASHAGGAQDSAGSGPAGRSTDARELNDALSTIALGLTAILVSVVLFLVGGYALIMGSRLHQWRVRKTRERPTAVDDLWLRHRLPENWQDTLDESPPGHEPGVVDPRMN